MSGAEHTAVIFGLSGTTLTEDEKSLFQACRPWGYILFSRNISNADQLLSLTDTLRSISGNPHLPILIDQEGGRVARLKPPLALQHPPAALYGKLYDIDKNAACEAARLGGQLIGSELKRYGITVDCLPCLDLGLAQTSEVIGDRSYGNTPDKVAALGRAAADGLMQAGVLPVIKHLPGHGRGQVDSHLALPVVDIPEALLQETDFESFRLCADLPLGMTGHLLFSALDAVNVSTHSAHVVSNIIRAYIGFDGMLMSDDISMQALSGTLQERALKSLAAGCDVVLHCNGDFNEMRFLADYLGPVGGESLRRARDIEMLLRSLHPDINFEVCKQDWGEIMSKHFPEAVDAL